MPEEINRVATDVFSDILFTTSQDDDQNFELRAIEFPRIAGGKPFDIDADWFTDLLKDIGQSKGKQLEVAELRPVATSSVASQSPLHNRVPRIVRKPVSTS